MDESVVAPRTLYVVATPIGNLGDITARACAVLGQVNAIAAEDTRVTLDLLRHLKIVAPKVLSVREHNENQAADGIVQLLAAGQSVAYVSDAGTPAVSDPGARLVRAVQDAGFAVVPVPGASAVTALLSASGLLSTAFAFYGFLPVNKKDATECLELMRNAAHTSVFFESTHRITDTCALLAATLGAREVVVGKELTKRFEIVARVPSAQLPAWLAAEPARAKGEFAIAISAVGNDEKVAPKVLEAQKWMAALAAELPPARAAKIVAKMTGVSREELYRLSSAHREE